MIIDNNYKVLQNTKNGAMDNFKINGKTLVNLIGNSTNIIKSNGIENIDNNAGLNNRYKLDKNIEYTLIVNISNLIGTPTLKFVYYDENNAPHEETGAFGKLTGNGILTYKFTPLYNINVATFYIDRDVANISSFTLSKVMMLVGDYTQNPPPYFEGLKSVGDGEKLEVLTVKSDGNLFNEDGNIMFNKKIEADGKINNADGCVVSDFIFSKDYKNITFSSIKNPSGLLTLEYDSNKNFLRRISGVAGNTIPISTDCYYIKLYLYQIETYAITTVKGYNICLNKGTKAIPYEPYKSSKQQIEYYPNRGSLFDVSKIPTTLNSYATDLSRESNVITVKGKLNSTVEAFTDATKIISGVYLEKDKKYTFEFKSDATFGGIAGADTVEMFWFLDGVSTGLNVVMLNVQGKGTLTCLKTGMYYPRFDVNKGDATHKFWDIFVSEGDTYKPIGSGQLTPVIARKISDTVKDTVDLSEGIYTKKCKVIVLNGSENIIVDPSPQPQVNTMAFSIPLTDKLNGALNLVCDKFLTKDNYNLDVEGIRGFTTATGILIRINKTKLATQDATGFKTWLQANNVTVVYELAKEELYECTKFYPSTFDLETTSSINSIIPTTYETDLVSSLVDMTRISNEQSKNLVSQKDKLSNILKNKNVEVLESDKLPNLINKVDNGFIMSPTMKRRGFLIEEDVLPLPSNRSSDSMDIYSMFANNKTLIVSVNPNLGRVFNLADGTYEQFAANSLGTGSTIYYKPRANDDKQYVQKSGGFCDITLSTFVISNLSSPNAYPNTMLSSLEDIPQIYAFAYDSVSYVKAYKYDIANNTWMSKAISNIQDADLYCFYTRVCAIPGGFLLLGRNYSNNKLNLYKYTIATDTFSYVGYCGVVTTFSSFHSYKSVGIYKDNKCTWFAGSDIVRYDMNTGMFSIASEAPRDFCIRNENQIFINTKGTNTGLSEITFLK